MSTNHQPEPLDYSAAAISAVALQLAAVPFSNNSQVAASLVEIQEWDPRTRLILLLRALSGRIWISDQEVYAAMKKEFYYSFNPYQGGLTRDAYFHYAEGCELVKEAAEYHRRNFTKLKNVSQS